MELTVTATQITEDFRVYPIETWTDRNGRVHRIQKCEELDPESGRWEPFISSWESAV